LPLDIKMSHALALKFLHDVTQSLQVKLNQNIRITTMEPTLNYTFYFFIDEVQGGVDVVVTNAFHPS
jgi:hypothetical protein